MMPSDTLSLIRGWGIEGDLNASAVSPRQVLITRKEDLDDLKIPYGGLRENIIVEGLTEKQFIPGSLITVNDTVKIRLMFYCEPCKRIADVVPSLKEVMHRRGILGVVISSGEIKLGDKVEVVINKFKPLPEIPYERFLDFVKTIPLGKVVTYKMVAQSMGVAEGFIRAMPKYIEKAHIHDMDIPVHRIVDETGSLITKYIPEQLELLTKEKIVLIKNDENTLAVDLERYRWSVPPLFLD